MFGRSKRGLRGAVGIAISYALALQLLLAGAVATRMALADPANPVELCTSDGTGHVPSDDSGKSSGVILHQTCAVCALAAHSPPLASSPSQPAFDAMLAKTEPWPAAIRIPGPDERHHPRSSQGPPAAA